MAQELFSSLSIGLTGAAPQSSGTSALTKREFRNFVPSKTAEGAVLVLLPLDFFLALCIMREIVLTLLISQLLADGSVDMVIPSGCRADNFLLGEAWRFKEFYYLHLQIS